MPFTKHTNQNQLIAAIQPMTTVETPVALKKKRHLFFSQNHFFGLQLFYVQ